MAQGIIVFDNMTNFETWVKDVDDALGYPDKHTETYTHMTEHPSLTDERAMCCIDDTCPEKFLKDREIHCLNELTEFLPKEA